MGVYSTSQFLGVAIGGALGGWVDGFFDSQTVFLLGALLAMLWLLVASTMSEPPYVSSLRWRCRMAWWSTARYRRVC